MGRIELLAQKYGMHIRAPWQRTVSGAQRVIMVIYEPELERTLRARKSLFENETDPLLRAWYEVDLTDAFARWMAGQEYREEYFASPDDLGLKIDGERSEFSAFVADEIRSALARAAGDSRDAVVAVFGVGSLFGFARVSQVLREVERDISGRLVVFFPGQYESNNYRLLDARDGWNYLAVPITVTESEHE
jgi:hypothetical protein